MSLMHEEKHPYHLQPFRSFSLLTLGPADPPKQWAKMAPGTEIFVQG